MVVSLPTKTSELTVMVAGVAPQLKVTTPPIATADRKPASVQLAALPSPTTVVGLDVSTGLVGTSQVAMGGGGTWSCPELVLPVFVQEAAREDTRIQMANLVSCMLSLQFQR
jgi:hypothetical protein